MLYTRVSYLRNYIFLWLLVRRTVAVETSKYIKGLLDRTTSESGAYKYCIVLQKIIFAIIERVIIIYSGYVLYRRLKSD